MSSLAITRKFTCRYWALGPGCPNVRGNGMITCDYAHFDTGKLASPADQPGTCLIWSQKGVCTGMRCPFEHRQTGVTGLYQGPLELSGTEIEIANAAFNAGFNTHDHEALFQLIWSVKRLGFKAVKAAQFGSDTVSYLRNLRPRPPPHPVYPDRYRPSGIGDNTKKKRKMPDDEPPQFHPTRPLMRRNLTPKPPAANSSKRRKTEGGSLDLSVPEHIMMIFNDVRSRLSTARKTMNISQNDLKIMFDKHAHVFDDDKVMEILEELAKNMNDCFDSAKDGTATIERAAEWLKTYSRDSVDTSE